MCVGGGLCLLLELFLKRIKVGGSPCIYCFPFMMSGGCLQINQNNQLFMKEERGC